MSATFDVRPTEPHEYRQACDTMRAALLTGPANDADFTKFITSWEQSMSISAWDERSCVGHAGAVRVDTVVPGGALLQTAGVTRVGVLPTHTRNGVLSRMMHRLMADARAEGAVLASLRASEAVIYERFGFGLANNAVTVKVDPLRVRPIRQHAAGSFRLLGIDQFYDVIPDLYARIPHRAGAITRPHHMWSRYFDGFLDGTKGQFVVVHTGSDGADDGYAHYQLAWADTDDPGGGKGEVFDVFATSADTELALWHFLMGIDLVRTWHLESRPNNDLLQLAARDRRGYFVTSRWDEQWMRLLDVDAALRARTYGAGESVTVRVVDPMFDDNNATWRVGQQGVEHVRDSVDIVAGIADLSAVYMGDVTWHSLADVGRVSASPEAIARADALFVHRPSTWCGSFF
jgi:predicted acetyltransferase